MPILPANVLEKYVDKSKEQNAENRWKIGKGSPRNGNLAYLYEKDRDTLIEQSRIVLGQHM